MTLRSWLLLAAVFCALALASIDLGWPFDIEGDRHLPAWLGLSLAFYMAREADR